MILQWCVIPRGWILLSSPSTPPLAFILPTILQLFFREGGINISFRTWVLACDLFSAFWAATNLCLHFHSQQKDTSLSDKAKSSSVYEYKHRYLEGNFLCQSTKLSVVNFPLGPITPQYISY